MVEGTFSIQLAHLQLRQGLPVAARGRMVWQRAVWLSPHGARPLGSYALDFEQKQDEALVADLVTIAGPVSAAGDIRLEGRSYALNILIGGESALEPQLQEALSLLAQPTDQGYRVELHGDF